MSPPTTPLERLDAAERAYNESLATLGKIEDAGASYASKIAALTVTQAKLKKALADAKLAHDIGTGSESTVSALRADLAKASADLVELADACEAAARRGKEMASAVRSAATELEQAKTVVATPLARDLENRAREAFRAFCELQREWLDVCIVGALPYQGACFTLHGDREESGSLNIIARDCGVSFGESFGPGGEHRNRLTLDELRALAGES